MTELAGPLLLILVAATGIFLGVQTRKIKSRWWMVTYVGPLALIAFMRYLQWNEYAWVESPLLWVVYPQVKPWIYTFATCLLLGTLLPRTERPAYRVILASTIGFFVLMHALMPQLLELAERAHLAGLETVIDDDGVCRQTTSYTCGPAAAVTALRKLGLPAEEAKVALAANTSPLRGTPELALLFALDELYAREGLQCEYKRLDTISELDAALRNGPVLTVVKLSTLVDHWVVVQQVGADGVLVGDPLVGLHTRRCEEFAAGWRHAALTLSLKPAQTGTSFR